MKHIMNCERMVAVNMAYLRVEKLRQERGWTLMELAKKSSVSKSVLGDIRLGTKTTLNSRQEKGLSQAFEIPISELYSEEGDV
jgi:transcriptional regulator with XRE-family HTH domain